MGIFSKKKSNNAANLTKEAIKSAGEVEEIKVDKLWEKCPECGEISYAKDIDKNSRICVKCGFYFNMSARKRIELLIDANTFEECDEEITASDPLNFPGYKKKYIDAKKETKLNDAVIEGYGKINGITINIAAMDFAFMGGSMGSVVGEKITRTIERGIKMKTPVVVVATGGGARMQEGIISLMQMAKTSAALEKLRENALPFISVPVNPTTGGISASFAMLGDIIITEPNALIAFAGPRVIEQTIKQKLPEGFQRSEFLLKHGMIDIISKREELKETLERVVRNLGFSGGNE